MRAVIAALIVVASASPVHAARATDPAAAVAGHTFDAAVVYDPATKTVLWAKRGNERRPVASLMKIATAVLVAERRYPTDPITISDRAARSPHDQVGWRSGARHTVDEVMHGALMMSSNGAARALAERAAGSVRKFRRLAAERLPQLGATDTRLVDPSGLDARGQYSTARDVAVLSARLLADPWLAKVVRTKRYTLDWPGQDSPATFRTINSYLYRDPTAVGVKNGFTSAAGNTLAAASTRGGRTHIVVVLGSDDTYEVAEALMDVAFEMAPPEPGLLPRPATVERSVDEAPEAEPEPATEVLGMTYSRSSIAETVPVAEPPAEPADPGGFGPLVRLALAAPVMLYGRRVWSLQLRRARRS